MGRARAWFAVSASLSASAVVFACGGGELVQRESMTPVGTATAYGAPRNTTYFVRAEPRRDKLVLIVQEVSECDRLRVKIVRRVVETLDGDEVVHRDPPTNVQVVEGTDGTVQCHERYARDVQVALQVGAAVHQLGAPGAGGEVWVDLSDRLRQDLYGGATPGDATVLVGGEPAGTVSLSSLNTHTSRVDVLLGEFRALLGKDTLTADEIARSYELYAMLSELAPGDARVRGLEARFIEVVTGRKQREATEDLRRNLKALGEAKGILGAAGAPVVPAFVQAAVAEAAVSAEALQWAQAQSLVALRRYPTLCRGGGGFSWSALTPDLVPPVYRVAFSYLRFAYSDPYVTEIRALCARIP